MTQDIIQADRSIFRRYRDMGDGTFAEIVVASNIEHQRELLVTRYTCKTVFPGAAVGNVIRNTDVLELGATPTVIASLWFNETDGSNIQAPASISGYLSGVSAGDHLTQGQLMASGLATAANQVTTIGYLADLADGNDKWAAYKLVKAEDLGAGTKYILKSDGANWLLIRKTYSDTASDFSYATPALNSSIASLTAAWSSRASLSYANPQA